MMKPVLGSYAMPQRERWMVSYIDVLTILLIFFIIASDRAKHATRPDAPARAAAWAPAAAPATPPGTPSSPQQSLAHARELLISRGIEASLEPRGLVIALPVVALFPSGGDHVSAEALPTLARVASALADLPNPIRLIGHADAVPIHNRRFADNWELSMARSRNMLGLLSRRFGIAEARLSIESRGPYQPAAPNDTADGRAANRRVEILVLNDRNVTGE